MFSIVIPLYNKEEHIQKTLESALAQNFKDFEIIIVDDGSKDKSLSIVESISDSRINVYSIKNGGASNARNFGIEKSTRDYIAFLDADDLWDTNYLQEMSQLIFENEECGMFSSAYRVIYEHKTITVGADLEKGVVGNYFKEMVKQTISWTSATIIKRNVFNDPSIGNFPIGMVSGQDSFMWAKVATKYKVAFTPKILASYLYINSGISLRHGRLDFSKEKWSDLLLKGDYFRNEYVAKKGLLVGIRYAIGGFKNESKEIEKVYSFTELSRNRYLLLCLLNRIPFSGVKVVKNVFNFYLKLKGGFN